MVPVGIFCFHGTHQLSQIMDKHKIIEQKVSSQNDFRRGHKTNQQCCISPVQSDSDFGGEGEKVEIPVVVIIFCGDIVEE